MKAIVLDVGNSHLRAKLWTGPACRATLQADPPLLETAFRIETRRALADLPLLRGEIDRLLEREGRPPLVLASVVPTLTDAIAALRADLRIIDHGSSLPFDLQVDEPEAVGPDRLCNLAAACAAGLKDAVIVDAGTATTFDILQDGAFVGGLIAPGMAFAAQQLGEVAARLQPQPFGRRELTPGRNTADAMAIGAWQVGYSGVEATLAALECRWPQSRTILTGGLGYHFRKSPRIFDADWTLRGAAHLAGIVST